MHCNLNIFLLDQLNKTYGGQYRQRGRRGPVQYHTQSSRPDDDQNEEDYDGSEFLNNTGEGDMIFDHDDRIDEVMNYDYDDDEENVGLETTKTGEVYIFI